MMKKIIAVMISAVILAGCSAPVSSKEPERADMSGYQYLEDPEPAFYEMTVTDIKEQMDQGESFAVYFGFAECPWCNEAVPVLNEAAKEAGMTVGYVDTRKDASWKSNTDIDGYDLFKEIAKDYLKEDENGEPHLYAPTVIFFKDGKIVKYHEALIEGYTPSEGRMSEEQQKELLEIYLDGFSLMK